MVGKTVKIQSMLCEIRNETFWKVKLYRVIPLGGHQPLIINKMLFTVSFSKFMTAK